MVKNRFNLKGKKKAMFEALISTLGNITKSAEKAGIDRTSHYIWLDNDDNYRQAYESIDDYQVDFYETALHQLIKDKNPTAVIFALKCKGKKRGYIERQELDISGNMNYKSAEFDEEVEKYLKHVCNDKSE